MDERSILLVSSLARRLRGLLAGDPADLRVALAAFEQMGAGPAAARVRSELGLLTGAPELVDRGLAELEAIGDLDHASRVAAERRAVAGGAPPAWLARSAAD